MERLWSNLRRFSHMTKEMRASHRIDVLTSVTSVLLHYGFKTTQKLGELAHQLLIIQLCTRCRCVLNRMEVGLKKGRESKTG